MTHGLHNLGSREGSDVARKRVGRGPGSGLGKTVGHAVTRGSSPAAATPAGSGGEGGQMPLHRRVPKRGFTNIFRKEWNTVTRSSASSVSSTAGATVDDEALRNGRPRSSARAPRVKILGTGDLKKAFTVIAHKFTEGARKKIEAAGGRCEEVQA